MASSSAAVERWRKLDFRTLQNELDAAAADIAVKQEESDLGRRKLVELSRDFRQTAPEEVRRQVQPVLKSFQTEVDSLLKRCKGAETAFLHVYRTFADLPDPSSIIEQLDHLEEQLAENKQLRAAVEEYEAQQLANKTQEAKAAREDFEARVEAEVLERLKLASDQLTGQFAEAQAEWNSEKAAMERRVADAEDQVGILRRELDRSHAEASRARSIANTQSEDEKIALMTEDLERATERAATAECKISELEQQVTALSKQAEKTLDSSNNSPSANNSENGPQRAAQVSQHQQDAVQRLRDELDRLKRSYQVQFDRMEDQLSRLTAQNTLLLRKLDAQRDYDEMKQQLSLLKAAQYSDDLTGGSLESILAARNRRLENENVALRVRESELADSLRRLEGEHMRQTQLMKDQAKLTERLEADLLRLQELTTLSNSGHRTPKEAWSGLSINEPDFVTDVLRSEQSNFDFSDNPTENSSGWNEAQTAAYIPILERQLERLREKLKELEASNHELQTTTMAVKAEMKAVKVDNVRLYERIRYLQSYEGRKSEHRIAMDTSGASQRTPSHDAESRYSSAYEAKLDPFSSFNRAERQRKYDALNPVDKVTLAVSNAILGSSISRKAFFIYALLLHLLVFVVVYKMAWAESSLRDFSYDCAKRFAEHMKGHSGGG
ncbi:hypothetical protein RvY_12008-2 [Ramazzottius varieornatus]|uniref:Protein CASP n=1 Tax=Ramazzottius varieornatus TaxID=947166 RepID=A0A1D1VRU2_RAMVA|nr:hypothetical protein RvY_12008-2 [Ramazzottius varieornatus]